MRPSWAGSPPAATENRLCSRHDMVEARAVHARHGYREIPRYNDDS
jgi:hypothetical protein